MRVFLFMLVMATAAAPARAQQAPDAEARARGHYDRGLTLYNLSKWDDAIDEFKKAYELSKAPGLIFNIAQAYRLKGDAAQALKSYRSYLRLDPSAPNRGEVEKRIAELEQTLKDQEKATAKPAPAPAPAPQPAPAPATRDKVMRVDANVMRVEVAGQDEDRSNRTLLNAGFITAGAGLILSGVGIYYGVKASSEWDEVESTVDRDGPWMRPDQENWTDAEDHERLAKVCLVAGGVFTITGAALIVFGTGAADSWIAAVPAPGGGTVTVRGEF
jgi:tetratricopeptide (TPR) repeat protein